MLNVVTTFEFEKDIDLEKKFFEEVLKMKKKFNAKAIMIGLASVAAGALVSAPALMPTQVLAAAESTESAGAAGKTDAEIVTETESKTVVWTIRCMYKNDDGSVKPVKSSDGSDYKVTRSATFTRTVSKDKQTGAIVSAGAWADPVKLADFEAPVISGYTPDKTRVTGITVSHDSTPQDAVIYFTENPENKKKAVTESKDVARKITYYRVNDDGSVTRTWSKTQRVTFTRTGTEYASGKKEFPSWNPHTWDSETVTYMDGYTPDITVIPSVTFTPDNPPADVSVYFRKNAEETINPDETRVLAAVNWNVKFTDGQGNTLEIVEVKDGSAAEAPAAPTREGYSFAGWDKAFDNVTGNLTVAAKWIANKTEWITQSRVVRRTISYLYENGTPVLDIYGKPAVEYIEQTFNRTGLKDLVTGKITKWSNWSNDKITFPAVTPISVKGYTPSIKQISATVVGPETKSWEIKVYYSKDSDKKIDNYTGVRYQNGEWIYVKNGAPDTSFTGVAQSTSGNWVFVRKGRWDYSYTGVAQSSTGNWVFVRKGRWDYSYTGVAQSTTGNWVFVKKGRVDFSYTGVAQSTTGNWVFVRKGRVDFNYTGVAQSTTGNWVFVKKGRVYFDYTGVAQSTTGNWVFVRKGRWDYSYTGVAQSITGNRVFTKNGRWDYSYTGYAKDLNGKTVYVKNGRVQ